MQRPAGMLQQGAGLRFSDFSTLKPEDLQRDMLYKKREKSDHWVIIPLREEAKHIFTRQFNERIPALTNPEFNRHIKTIGKLAALNCSIKFSYKKGNKSIEVIKSNTTGSLRILPADHSAPNNSWPVRLSS